MASDLLVEFRELMKTRMHIDHRLVSHGITVDGRKIEWPDNLAGQASLVQALRQANVRLGSALDQLDKEEHDLDDAISSDLTLRRITPSVELQPRRAWAQ